MLSHPNQGFFLSTLQRVPSVAVEEGRTLFHEASSHPEYALLSSLLARHIAFALPDEHEQEAVDWARKALAVLSKPNIKGRAYGDDTDYRLSVQQSMLVYTKLCVASTQPSHWVEAERCTQRIMDVKEPSIATSATTSDDTISLDQGPRLQMGLLRIRALNQLGRHAEAMHTASAVQATVGAPVEMERQAGFLWGVSTLLLGKEHALNLRHADAEAAWLSAEKVFSSAMEAFGRGQTHAFAKGCGAYAAYLAYDQPFEVDAWDDDVLHALSTLVEQHTLPKEQWLYEQFHDALADI